MTVLLWDVLLEHLNTATLLYLYAVTINFKRQHISERILKTQSSCNREHTHEVVISFVSPTPWEVTATLNSHECDACVAPDENLQRSPILKRKFSTPIPIFQFILKAQADYVITTPT